MFSFRFLFIVCCFVSAVFADHPESQIIVLENFISPDAARVLMQYYDRDKQNLNNTSDNELSLSSISDPYIRQIVLDISNQVLLLMRQCYPLMNRNYLLDHAGLYARIPRNYCPYHADNIYFECPIHGKNQMQLRTTCPGNCPGAGFIPNHTYWREYTALIYLNDAFEGGQIAFEDGPQNKLYKKFIKIKANMLILAPNGKDFYHEVYPILSGKRYSLHLWFTSDPQIQRYW